eukprot:8413811-Pyramimonas_sp.AAC.1
MVAAALDIRARHGRSDAHGAQESTDTRTHNHSGRAPIGLRLVDFLQLQPAGSIGLPTGGSELLHDGSCVHTEPPTLDTQPVIKVFSRIFCAFELKGAKRFEPGALLV